MNIRNPNPGQNDARYTISRIMLISPEQNELLRRNRSRIFIWPQGEAIIDSLLFQAYRPMEDFIEVAQRAIVQSGLTDASGNDVIFPVSAAHFAGGMLSQHLASHGWLTNGDQQVFDLVLEVAIGDEDLPEPDVQTYNAVQPDATTGENPLCIVVDVSQLTHSAVDFDQPDQSEQQISETSQEGVASEEEAPQAETNRESMSARQGQDRDQGGGASGQDGNNMGRQAGKPGRVRDPSTDMRLKANRMARQRQDTDQR